MDGDPYDLTDANLELLIKPAADTPDDGPGVVVLSTGTGEITITDAEPEYTQWDTKKGVKSRESLLDLIPGAAEPRRRPG